jgi:hypothetical protein
VVASFTGPNLRIERIHHDNVAGERLYFLQLVRVMDNLLKQEHLDLRLTPYWVLPMSPSLGILEFVPSTTLQEVTTRSKSEGILRFLAEHNPATPGQSLEVAGKDLRSCVAAPAMENFVRSNAGYAIISYLLDMGDRHQENLLLTTDGRLFHIGAHKQILRGLIRLPHCPYPSSDKVVTQGPSASLHNLCIGAPCE